MNGKIKKLFDGFGFITGEDGEEYFFHSSALDAPETMTQFHDLAVGQDVEFEETEGKKGLRAEQVRLA